MRDIKVIMGKFFNGFIEIMANVVDNQLTRFVTYFAIVYIIYSVGQNFIASFLVLAWISYFIRETMYKKDGKHKN